MISVGDIKNILIGLLKANPVLGLIPEIEKNKHAPVSEGDVNERIVVVCPGGASNGQIERAYPRICVYVPDVSFTKTDGVRYYRPDEIRLKELEQVCIDMFEVEKYDRFNGKGYLFRLDTIITEADPETWSSFLNARLEFRIINFLK